MSGLIFSTFSRFVIFIKTPPFSLILAESLHGPP
jgi:hypothetical protein